MKQVTITLDNLKKREEYVAELKQLHDDLEISLVTDTLIKDDLKMLTRIDELCVLINFIDLFLSKNEVEQ